MDVAGIPQGSGLGRVRTLEGERVVIHEPGGGATVATVRGTEYDDLPMLLAAAALEGTLAPGRTLDIRAEDLLAPIARPRKIICVGQNYLDHVEEAGRNTGPAHPDLFAKWDNSLVGPYDNVLLPPESDQVDYEAELAVVVGQRCRRVAIEDVGDVVFGYTAANDGSVRDFQFHTTQRTAGKAWDGLTPIGPVVVPAAHLGGVHPDLALTGLLNGEVYQDDRTSSLMFGIPELVAYITTFMTLEPGDIILTGTPSGVGAARKPPVYLRPGDTYEVRIEGIGSLRNECRAEGD